MTQAELARALGISPGTIDFWRQNDLIAPVAERGRGLALEFADGMLARAAGIKFLTDRGRTLAEVRAAFERRTTRRFEMALKVAGDGTLSLYVPFSKRDNEARMVYGFASTPDVDSQGDRVLTKALEDALPSYLRFGNVREMHGPSAVGKTKETNIDERGLYIGVKVVDDAAWNKVKEGVYNGFSIGGRVTKRVDDEIHGLDLIEISLVDRPANASAVFDIWKAATFASVMQKHSELFPAGGRSVKEALVRPDESADEAKVRRFREHCALCKLEGRVALGFEEFMECDRTLHPAIYKMADTEAMAPRAALERKRADVLEKVATAALELIQDGFDGGVGAAQCEVLRRDPALSAAYRNAFTGHAA